MSDTKNDRPLTHSRIHSLFSSRQITAEEAARLVHSTLYSGCSLWHQPIWWSVAFMLGYIAAKFY